MNENNTGLIVEKLTKEYPVASGTLTVLNGLDLSMNRGESIAITGPSGSGKSTFLYAVGTLEEPSSGTVSLFGQNPYELDAQKLAEYRNTQIGFVFQDHNLLPQCSVLENVLIPVLAQNKVTSDDEQRARGLIDRVGLGKRKRHRPGQLSGGERQRVAVCRALINQPSLILADEPTGNLDHETADSVGSLLIDLNKEFNTMLICVTHSQDLAARFPKRMELRNGTWES